MAKKHMKKYLSSLAIKEIQISLVCFLFNKIGEQEGRTDSAWK
jgi:hypothetical protein